MKKIEKGIFKGLYKDIQGYIFPIIPEDFPWDQYHQDKQCSCYYDGTGDSKRTYPCLIHDYMCSVSRSIKERFISDLVLAYNIKHLPGNWNKYFHWWIMSIGTIPYGFIKHFIF